MTTLYWQIAPELDQLRRQAEQMLEAKGQPPAKPHAWKPAAQLQDFGDRYQLQLQLPGVDAATLDIQATQASVTVAGDRPATQAQLIHSEFRSGAFERSVRLPEGIQNQAISANYVNGLLTLNLPKLTAAPEYRVKVAVQAAAESPEEAAASVIATDTAVAANTTEAISEAISPVDSSAEDKAGEAEDLWGESV